MGRLREMETIIKSISDIDWRIHKREEWVKYINNKINTLQHTSNPSPFVARDIASYEKAIERKKATIKKLEAKKKELIKEKEA